MVWCTSFVVNMGRSNEDRILMETLYFLKSYGAKKRTKEFPNKGWGLQGLNKLLKSCKK